MLNKEAIKERGIVIIGGCGIGKLALVKALEHLVISNNLSKNDYLIFPEGNELNNLQLIGMQHAQVEFLDLPTTEGIGKVLTIDTLMESKELIEAIEHEKFMRMLDDLGRSKMDEVFEIKAVPRYPDVTVLTDKLFNRFGYKPHPSKASDRKNFERNNKHKHKRK